MGIPTLISTSTPSNAATTSITSGITSSYDEYMFVIPDIRENAGAGGTASFEFQFNGSIDSGSNYNVAKTTTFFKALHEEDDGAASLAYVAGDDLAQGTGFQNLIPDGAQDDDASHAGILHLFSPANTTYVKHFYGRFVSMGVPGSDRQVEDLFVAGYFNTTSAIDAIQFKLAANNHNGTIQMYGIS